MAEAIVSVVLEQLASILRQQVEAGVKLVVGVEDEVQKLTSNFGAIKAVLEDAESREVKENAVRDWMDKLKDTSYDIEDVLDEWNTAIQKLQLKKIENASGLKKKVRSLIPAYRFSPKQIVLRHEIATKIKGLNKKLDDITKEKDMFNFRLMTKSTSEVERQMTTSMIDLSRVYGRDLEKAEIVDLLLSGSSQEVESVPIISIVGMGGSGKTTLAKLVYHDDRVNTHFNKTIWVCVSDPFDEIRIARAILESLQGSAREPFELQTLLERVSEIIVTKKFLLILDDVWTEHSDKWEQLRDALKCGCRGSRILLTTRKENVTKIMGSSKVISLGKLSDEDSWSLFSQVALFGKTKEECDNLEDVGRKVVKKCDGLPLALKTLGSLLSLKGSVKQWQSVLDSEMWELEEMEEKLFPPLLLSYYDLSPKLRKCFLFCAIFPQDYKIKKDKLIKFWMAQGYLNVEGRDDMELIGDEYFENLAMRSFFQDFEKDVDSGKIQRCKMHDIVHDFAQFLAKNECSNIISNDPRKGNRKARHFMMKNVESIPSFVYDEIKLRSFVFDVKYSDINGLQYSEIENLELLNKLTCLRILDLHYNGINLDESKFLKGINKLAHLRYVKLIALVKLPEELCDLCNLQTLILSDCFDLKRLPERIGELINLRHLINKDCLNLEYMPKGMERLTCLRTLSRFAVSSDKKASSLTCLSELKHLQGNLFLSKLGGTRDIIGGELLKNKTKLLYLTLQFDDEAVDEHEAVLEFLQPPPSLEKLEFWDYQGITASPSWMPSLTKLGVLSLLYCSKCERLPCTLAKLPSLESLEISYMKSIKRVGNEFLGILEEASLSSSSTPSSSTIIAFPKLKYLKFLHMGEWEEWSCTNTGENDIKIMPCLEKFEIYFCKKLKKLPVYIFRSTSLKMLEILYCDKLEDLYRSVKAEDSPNISPIPNIIITDQFVRRLEGNNL